MENNTLATTKARKSTKRVRFVCEAMDAKKVFVVGDFNGWDETTHELKEVNGVHTITLYIFPGVYQYKFLVDGEWCIDMNNLDWVPNPFGGLNSIIKLTEGERNKMKHGFVFCPECKKPHKVPRKNGKIDCGDKPLVINCKKPECKQGRFSVSPNTLVAKTRVRKAPRMAVA